MLITILSAVLQFSQKCMRYLQIQFNRYEQFIIRFTQSSIDLLTESRQLDRKRLCVFWLSIPFS